MMFILVFRIFFSMFLSRFEISDLCYDSAEWQMTNKAIEQGN